MRAFSFWVFCAACGGSSVDVPSMDGGSGSDAIAASDAITASDAMDASLSSCKAPTVNLTFSSCPPPPTCGGALADGSYFYTSGCVPNPWAGATQTCMALKVSEEKGTVKGCVTLAGGVAARDVTATYGAKLDVPASCTAGGVITCAQIEAGLKNLFTTASCSPGASVGSCTCAVSSTTTSVAAVGYTTQASQLVTSTNNRYDYCVQGAELGLRWASGPNQEIGIYKLTKQ